MNNPLASGSSNFRIVSQRNRLEDEGGILDRRSEFLPGGNPCSFPTRVYVIHRSERTDRWERFKDHNSELFQNFKVVPWEATIPCPGAPTVVDAIFDSFYNCIKNSPGECVIIMEDDSYLVPGALEKIQKAWTDLPPDWDVVIGNHYFFGSMKVLSDHLGKPIGRASTLNFSIIRKTILPKIEFNLHLREIPSLRDFDHYITSDQTPINNFTIWPMVSREFPSFSDHKGKDLDSSHKIREHAFKYLFVDQETYYSSLEEW